MTGVLTGIYMLLSGAIANYLAGVIADQTSQASFDASGAINYSINAYIEVFDQITGRTGVCRSGVDDLAVSGAEIQKPRAGAGILIDQHRCLIRRSLRFIRLLSSLLRTLPAFAALPLCDQLSVADNPASYLLSAPTSTAHAPLSTAHRAVPVATGG